MTVAQHLARALHGDPEIAWQEVASADRVRAVLRDAGFAVSAVADLPTAFVAQAGEGATTVAICVEYDALPGLGHACGHHLIAGAGVDAALRLLPDLDALGLRLKVVGCPAEERGGGKIALLEQDVFDDVDAALMVHFVPEGYPIDPAGTTSYAVARERMTFTGRAAHAAAAPWAAVNAADAAVVAQVAVGLLRQQTRDGERIGLHVSHGGRSTNIVPNECTVDVECRAADWDDFLALRARVRRCFEAGATATGCALEVTELEPPYRPLHQDAALAQAWTASAIAAGFPRTTGALPALVSTDMGDVSHRVPSIHPWISIPGVHAPIHTEAFAEASVTPAAFEAMVRAGDALARTIRSLA